MDIKKKCLLTLLFVLSIGRPAAAQFYPTRFRPPHLNWQQLSTSHFKILFPEGEESVAWRAAHILEREYPKVQKLTGGELSNFPVILSDYNDQSNGRVTSLHFRSEVDINPIKGKALNPETGGWLENVLPHELTHALHFSHLGGPGLGQFVNIFSPDIARSMHGASPSGIQEGLAVYFESNDVTPGGGRGNYPFYTGQFDAVFNSPARWSMGQMVHYPAYTRPFNRYYIGGYEFTQWLQDAYGPQTSRDAIDFHIRWPFLGYGVALKHSTGLWPAQLYHRFEDDKEAEQQNREHYSTLPIDGDGAEIRRPKWLSDSTLVFFGSFYNTASGFYTFDLNSHALHRRITTGSVTDYNYALTNHSKTLLYSYNRPDPIYPDAYHSTLVQASLTDGSTQTIAADYRLFAPAETPDSTLYAIESNHTTGKLVAINNKTNQLVTLFSNSNYQIISAAIHPNASDSLAVIMNHHGNEALWLTSRSSLSRDLKSAPTISFPKSSVFDAVWHPDGDQIMFSSDFSGTLQVYEYDLQSGTINQITDATYNAFEASYCPDGNRIAFIIQHENHRLPVVLSRDQFLDKKVGPSHFNLHSASGAPGLKVQSSPDTSWKQQSYHTGFSWLKPRTVLPAATDVSGSNDQYQFGVGLYSSDLLQQQSYGLELTTLENRLWYDLTYQNKQFFPGFKARVFSRPAYRRYQFVTQSKDTLAQTFLRQERSFALSVPMQFTLQQNVDFTGLYFEPELRQSQLRYFDDNGTHPSDFSNATIGNIFGQFNYRLRQHTRDVQPSNGIVLYSEVEHYFTSEGLTLHTVGGQANVKFSQPTALRGGIYGYVSPLRRWNQSLRIGLEGITQTAPVFDNQSVVSEGFDDNIFPLLNNLISLSGRYTIPLFYPDNGGLLVPLYLSSVYLSAFSDTVVDPAHRSLSESRTVIGAGLRIQFRISNLAFDVGAGISMEPSRHKINYFIGDF